MALIACQECQQQISEFANQCPQCGFPLKLDAHETAEAQIDEATTKTVRPTSLFQRRKGLFLLGFGMVCALAVAAFLFFQSQQSTRAIDLYRAGKVHEAEKVLEQLVAKPGPDPGASLYYGKILLEKGELDKAEQNTDRAIQAMYQQKQIVAGMKWEYALGTALFQKGQIRIARSLAFVNDTEEDWALDGISQALLGSRESIEAAHQLIPDQPEWKAAIDLLDGLGLVKGKNGFSRSNYPAYVAYVRHVPAFQRLNLPAEIKPEPSPTVPTAQEPIRTAIQRWQSLKRQAFVTQDTSELQDALTGSALEETIAAANWWKENGESYHDMILRELRFVEILYQDPEHASAKVAVKETRDNTREGRIDDSYQALYQLERIGTGWYINKIEVQR